MDNEMGSTITGGNHSVQIQASDAAGDNFTQVQLLRNGVVINTWTPGTNTVNITQSLNVYDGEYYYVRVKQSDTDEAISSPVWVEGGVVNLPPAIHTHLTRELLCLRGGIQPDHHGLRI